MMWSKQLWTCWWYVQSSGFKRRCLACSPSLWSLGKLSCHSISEGGKETWLYFTRVIFYFHDFVFLISIFLFSWCLLHYFSLVILFGFGEACVCLFSGTWFNISKRSNLARNFNISKSSNLAILARLLLLDILKLVMFHCVLHYFHFFYNFRGSWMLVYPILVC